MAPTLSKLKEYQSSLICLSGLTAAAWIIIYGKSTNKKRKLRTEDQIQYTITDKKEKRVTKAHVNAVFFRQLRELLRIIIPGPWSKETMLLLLIAASLVARSASDIWMIQSVTMIESTIIQMDRRKFLNTLFKYCAALPLISVVNNVLRWSIGELKLSFRVNLSKHMYNQYLRGFTFYKMSNLDNRISNADQLLTNDVDKFCESVTDFYSNASKPLLDIIIYMYRLTTTIGAKTPSILLLYLFLSGVLLTHLRKPTGRLTVQEQKLEGDFRYVNSRLITNSEEIAFYQGNNREKLTVLASFSKLTQHLRKFLEFKVGMGIVDNMIAANRKLFFVSVSIEREKMIQKLLLLTDIASAVGFYTISIPFFTKNHPLLTGNETQRLTYYYTYGRMLLKLAEALGRLVLAGRELSRLAGFTARITELSQVLKDLNNGSYERPMVSNSSIADADIAPCKGQISFQDNIIRFEAVPLVTPNGDVLVRELTFEVKSGCNVLVCGPNGCGKSSLFRILGELWPSWGGKITKPPRGKLFYIPQRPYMTLGTLRDQIIYPHTFEEMKRRGHTDADLQRYLELVQLPYLQVRERGLDAVEDWIDILSGGEKQRIAMARLFYHSPQFAILDECTSAVSVDVEGSMYQYCKKSGITLFTVSHRKSLWKYHEYYLQFDGRGDYEFGRIDEAKEEFGS